MMYKCCSPTQARLKQGFAISKMREALLFPEVCNYGVPIALLLLHKRIKRSKANRNQGQSGLEHFRIFERTSKFFKNILKCFSILVKTFFALSLLLFFLRSPQRESLSIYPRSDFQLRLQGRWDSGGSPPCSPPEGRSPPRNGSAYLRSSNEKVINPHRHPRLSNMKKQGSIRFNQKKKIQ